MKANCRIKEERKMHAVFIVLFVIAIITISIATKAQTQFDPVNGVTNATKKIHISRRVNLEVAAELLKAPINSAYAELKPTLTPNGSRLYFSRSFHPENTDGETDPEDIWYSNFDKSADTWSEPVRLPGFLNNNGPNFINNVSTTGDTVILGNQYGKGGKMRAGLSYSVNVNGQWSAPLPIHILNDYNVSPHSNSFVSLKTGVIIKAIERDETFGERDLYVSLWDGEKATEPINMGNVLNTSLDESSPFLADDNVTLYFASKGQTGYGGYDIFVTKRLDDSWTNWTVPENLGPGVNGTQDEEFFSTTHCGKYGVFSRRVSIHNTDLYKISMDELYSQPAKASGPETPKSLASFSSL